MFILGNFLTSSPAPADTKCPAGSQCWGAWGNLSCFIAISYLHPEGKFSPKSLKLWELAGTEGSCQLPGGLQTQVQTQTDLQGK